jgi:hypothetical protein
MNDADRTLIHTATDIGFSSPGGMFRSLRLSLLVFITNQNADADILDLHRQDLIETVALSQTRLREEC